MIKRPGSGKLRIRLVRDLTITIIIASAITLFIVLNYSSGLVRSISISHIQKTTQAAVSEFQAITLPIENNLKIINRWCQAGLIDINKPEELNRKLIPILELMPNASAIIIVSSSGAEYFLMRDSSAWRTRVTNQGKHPGKSIERKWSADFKLLETNIINTTIDPKSRIWYSGTADSATENKIFWTQPFFFEIQQKLGISAAIKSTPSADPGETYVIDFDLPITEFYKMVSSQKPSVNGHTFLFLADGSLFDLRQLRDKPGAENKDTQVFLPIKELPSSAKTAAIKMWQTNPARIDESFEFKSGGETWWGGIHRLNPDGGRVWMGIVIPQRDLIGQLYDFRYLVFLAVFLTIGIALYLIARFTQKYIKKIRQLPATRIDPRHIEEDINSIIKSGESKNVEFKSTMRMNLKSGKHGKEIEQAWLKSVTAFLNTDGGMLLIGVNDAGEIVGIEADEFENDDKCRLHFKNLIQQHIGLEYSEFIQMDVHNIQSKKIVLIEVDKSSNPAFLKMKEEEEFYIRSGPSSVKLPVSKVLTYLKQQNINSEK